VPKHQLLLINDDEEQMIDCPYIPQADSKIYNAELL